MRSGEAEATGRGRLDSQPLRRGRDEGGKGVGDWESLGEPERELRVSSSPSWAVGHLHLGRL